MATHASALKRHRQSLKRKERNRERLSRLKTLTKKAETVQGPDAAIITLKSATSAIDKAKTKGALHRNTAARKISRLAKRVNRQLTAASAS